MEAPSNHRDSYARVDQALAYLRQHANRQPSLAAVAAVAGLSPHYFQRVFRRYTGVTPKQFLQTLTVANAKAELAQHSVLDAAYACGLSSAGRLHDHFVTLEAVTPGEFKRRGHELTIRYGTHPSPFGTMFLAATERGICWLAFVNEQDPAPLLELQHHWANANCVADQAFTANLADQVFQTNPRSQPLHLLVHGTNFQVQVWRALLAIPIGETRSYGDLAKTLDNPRGARAVGSAVGKNNIGFLVPCHRVITSGGQIGGFRWGPPIKQALLNWESTLAET